MNKLFLFKTGAIAYILLGLLHLLAHFGIDKNTEASQLMLDMQAFKIQLFGEHSLLKFHKGFSIMMGFSISAFGLQSLLSAKSITQTKSALLVNILITAISFGIAFLYFHILAYGFFFFSLLCFTASAFMSEERIKQAKTVF